VSEPEIVRLDRAQVPALGRELAGAFQDDPGLAYLVRDPKRRTQILPGLMEGVVRYGLMFGEVFTTAGEAKGAAVWLRPPKGRRSVSYMRMVRAGMLGDALRLGLGAVWRSTVMGTHIEWMEMETVSKPHWYLWLLGVGLEWQGKGIGGALIRPIVERASSEGLPCVLETMTERNVRFYRKQGFEVAREGKCPLNGPYSWILKREPGGRNEA
jgi:ribosomal protein S18 acetylase RimI-like enzyme